jgi:hypothetical protein
LFGEQILDTFFVREEVESNLTSSWQKKKHEIISGFVQKYPNVKLLRWLSQIIVCEMVCLYMALRMVYGIPSMKQDLLDPYFLRQ